MLRAAAMVILTLKEEKNEGEKTIKLARIAYVLIQVVHNVSIFIHSKWIKNNHGD